MNANRHQHIGELYHQALDLPRDRRDAFLQSACAGDPDLLREVESLLDAHEQAGDFITEPAIHIAAAVVASDAAARPAAPIFSRIGPYEVVSLLGRGGMGEVYRGRDARLGRDVALKVLPERFARDAQRLARFEREARVLASLNHPSIAALYGLEEAPGGRQALVMELVEGVPLTDVIASGAVPVPDALAIARRIAEALEAAHDQGLIHRDLKPANVVVRPDGTVKVLDFGLGKAIAPNGDGHVPAHITGWSGFGTVLGTPSYMSPEQVRGAPVDRRADIWAFGCVLYEMLTGERAFGGNSTSDVVARVIERDPDFEALPFTTPTIIQRLLRRCLQKNARERLRDIGDAILDLNETLAGYPSASRRGASLFDAGWAVWRRPPNRWSWLFIPGAAAAVLTVWLLFGGAPSSASRPVQTSITSPELAGVEIAEGDRLLAITPDGTRVVFAGNHGVQLFVRPLDRLNALPLTAPSIGVRGPFVSPDSQWVGYVEGNFTLKVVPLSGGEPVTVAALDGPSRGASWESDETILLTTSNTATGLQRVTRSGNVTVLTRPDASRNEADHVFPEVLPGGGAALMTVLPISGRMEEAQIASVHLATGVWTSVLRGGYNAHYLRSGHLIYVSGVRGGAGMQGDLYVVPFDLDRLQIRGAPRPLFTDLATVGSGYGVAHFDVATDGTLVYLDAARAAAGRTLVWVDRQGRETPLTTLPVRAYALPRVSPDGTRLAIYVRDAERDLWIWDLHRGLPTRLTFGPDIDAWPVWTSSDRLVFGSHRATGTGNVFMHAADGTGSTRQLTESATSLAPVAAVPDGSAVVVSAQPSLTGNSGWNLRLLRLPASSADTRVEPVDLEGLNTRFNERHGTVSPNGRYIAYDSDSAGGRFEVFVRPFPDVAAGVWQISSTGGQQPTWSPDGRELFYRALNGAMVAVRVDMRGTTFEPGTPEILFNGDFVLNGTGNIARQYDVSPDGERFLMLKDGDGSPSVNQIVVVQQWLDDAKRLANAP